MNGIRINTAFGDETQYGEIIANVHRIGKVPTLLDLKGPEVRLKAKEKTAVKTGDNIIFGNDADLSFSWDIYRELEVGDHVLFDDGKIQAEVMKANESEIQLQALSEGVLENGKGVNFPGKTFTNPTLSTKDLKLVELAQAYGVEFIGLSFVRTSEDINQVRQRIGKSEASIIAKIENAQGVKNFKEILDAADGIMIARGDLGIELPPEIATDRKLSPDAAENHHFGLELFDSKKKMPVPLTAPRYWPSLDTAKSLASIGLLHSRNTLLPCPKATGKVTGITMVTETSKNRMKLVLLITN